MSVHCAQCLSPVARHSTSWECPDHGVITTVLTTQRVSPELLAQVSPLRRARGAAKPVAQVQPPVLTRRCRVCHAEFAAKSSKHRYCPLHVERLHGYLSRASSPTSG
ncbi:MAG TPA: hypothetical protein VD838_23140 [Anaeromyxobacteraceae bacterium]|nr:hypothetical protein [Anaeromyxobacteraceae bacterium]